ncbi:lysine--tRNA ligase [Patescibacteria group bacterium]
MPKPLEELRKIRLEKLEKLRKLGIEPYPAKANRKHSTAQAQKKMGQKVAVAGRVMAKRGHGKIQFWDLSDESGKIQLVFKEDKLINSLTRELVTLIDIGDFIDVQGKVFKTKAGEKSVEVNDFHLLTKSIRPLPEKWQKIKDQELVYRRRYLDLAVNPERREMFKRKARFWELNREFMKKEGFIEVETPILEHRTGGADARPFVTHFNTLGQDFYLRISPELYLKRLIGGGFEKVFVLGPNFRNEGISDEHLPEYYAIEWYWAYADYQDNMAMIKKMFRFLAKELYGKTRFKKGKLEYDLADEWKEIDYTKILKEKLGVDIFKSTEKEMMGIVKKAGIELSGEINRYRLIDNLWKLIRKDIAGPAFLVNEPKFMSPLAKSKPDDPRLTQRFHVLIAGRELGNGYSELNDPLDQLERFKDQQSAREAGDEEAQMMDIDFVEMLEYGMPPTTGYAHSERLFWTLEGVTAREGTLFPALRFKQSETSKAIYGINKK